MIIKSDPDTIRSYFEDSSNLKGGFADEVVYPEEIEEMSLFLEECSKKRIPVTVSGGGTGTTGSRIPFGGAVISTERLNKIIHISKQDSSCVVQAGVLAEDVRKACEREGLFYTSHPTETTASIGGTVATNASGARSFKYGSTRRYVKRLKMVLSNGEILEIKRGQHTLTKKDSRLVLAGGSKLEIPLPAYRMPEVKNSAGYFVKDEMDAIDLFIGQEGTLSIVIEIELGLVRRPEKIFSLFVFFKQEESAWNFTQDVRKHAKSHSDNSSNLDILSIEYFDSNALRILRDVGANIPGGRSAAIFLEEVTANESSPALWERLISKHNASMDDTWVAMNESESDKFTKLRHLLPEAVNDIVRQRGSQKLSTDIAVPEKNAHEMFSYYRDVFRTNIIEHAIFGHIGENHLHINLFPKSEGEMPYAKKICLDFVKKGVSLGGTVSAEHGIGKTKHEYLEVMYGKEAILEMAMLKKSLDASLILGLDNIFPKEYLGI